MWLVCVVYAVWVGGEHGLVSTFSGQLGRVVKAMDLKSIRVTCVSSNLTAVVFIAYYALDTTCQISFILQWCKKLLLASTRRIRTSTTSTVTLTILKLLYINLQQRCSKQVETGYSTSSKALLSDAGGLELTKLRTGPVCIMLLWTRSTLCSGAALLKNGAI